MLVQLARFSRLIAVRSERGDTIVYMYWKDARRIGRYVGLSMPAHRRRRQVFRYVFHAAHSQLYNSQIFANKGNCALGTYI